MYEPKSLILENKLLLMGACRFVDTGARIAIGMRKKHIILMLNIVATLRSCQSPCLKDNDGAHTRSEKNCRLHIQCAFQNPAVMIVIFSPLTTKL